MSITLGLNLIEVEDKTVKVSVPPNDLARLMYYLKCISCAINYNDVTQEGGLINCTTWVANVSSTNHNNAL
jgi:hypothetical protein